MSTYRPIPLGPSPLNNVPLYNNPPGDRLGLRLPHVILLLLFPRGIHAMARYTNKGERERTSIWEGKKLGAPFHSRDKTASEGGGAFFWALSRAATVAAQKAGGLGGRAGRSGGKGKAALRLHIGANINKEKALKRKEGRCPFMCAW